MVRTAVFATFGLLAAAASLHAQAPPEPPDDYVLTNARIVVSPGRVIERGTIVIRDGRITAVGERAQAPADALTFDLDGLTVYPGLIDVASTTGMPQPAQGGGRFGGGGGGPNAAQETEQTETVPGRIAAEAFAPGETDLQTARRAGFTTLGLTFQGGIFPGQTSAVTTLDGAPGEQVLRSPVALQVQFGRNRGRYPGTLMGAIAYIKQSFYDARHQAAVAAAFERNPSGAPRPVYDPEHTALQTAAANQQPIWFDASARRDYPRVLDIVAELGLTNYAFLGGTEAYQVTDLLKSTGRPVIVSLDYPRVDQVSGRSFEMHVAPVTGEDSAKIQADSAAARQLRGNAAALAAAGIPFALTGRGLSNPTQFRDRIRGAIEAGLSEDDALRALTLTPAALLGLEAVIGTVEAGKFANLLVVEGELFDEDAKLRHVFVEGRRFDPPPPAPRGQRGAGGEAGEATAIGTWTGSFEGPAGTAAYSMVLSGTPAALTGELVITEMATVQLRGQLVSNALTLHGTVEIPGMSPIEIAITGTITGDELNGTITAQGMPDTAFTGRRTTPGGL
jgi:imidazolonepropionase-like amidohydrolase